MPEFPPAAIVAEDLGDRVVLTLSRPAQRNAIDQQMVSELHEACARLEADPKVALLVGEGGTFAAGADIAQLRERGRSDALRGINSGIFDRIRSLPMPIIALIDGYALGGGAELAYACDFRLGTPRVKIGNPEPGLGILAAAGASWRLAELVGEPVAKEILLAGRILDAAEARAVQLLNEIVDPGTPAELLAAGHAWADRITRQSALAIRLTKSVFHAPREAHPLIDDIAQAVLFETAEKHERMTAFLDRKRPDMAVPDRALALTGADLMVEADPEASDQETAGQGVADRSTAAMWAGDAASHALGMEILDAGPGRATVAMTVRPDMLNGWDICHGGLIATLADSAFAVACNSRGQITVAAGFDIAFLESARLGDRLVASARETALRGRSGIYDVTVRREADDVVLAECRGRSRAVGRPNPGVA